MNFNISRLGTVRFCEYLIVFLYLIGLIFIPITPHVTNKIINLAGVLSIVLVIFNLKRYFRKDNSILFFAIIILGILNLAWYNFYKTPVVIYKNAYRGYLEVGKMTLFSSFSFLIMSSCFIGNKFKIQLLLSSLAQVLILSRAFYQGVYLDVSRIPLSAMDGNAGQMGAATVAAYMITFSAIYFSLVILRSELKYKMPVFYFNFILTFCALIMTGTRAAIFTYPIVTFVLLVIEYRRHKVYLAKAMCLILMLLLVSSLVFKNEIKKRIDAIGSDIVLFKKDNSISSIGARFSMIQAGFKSSPMDLSWQSLEERGQKIITLSKEDEKYKGATLYLDVHMHNEVIEALSTKGIFGVITLFFFYCSLVWYCIRTKKYLLLAFPMTMVLFGLSDVIIHAKPIPASWIITPYLSILLLNDMPKKNERKILNV
ncbi:O-antigen ligase family protein [Obesumbacterium proteus]|uniref:O-antigen ligase family protein n=1 Tax=Obesumbacterium proteus TaxID=82983 RepID=UPI00243329A7|nr:O-antigen ligase family protein [Obesumbacterium proteus]